MKAVPQQGLEPEGEEDQDVKDKPFKHPINVLVKNCNMLHNIVGPACVFLKQGFSQTLVCNSVDKVHIWCPHMAAPSPPRGPSFFPSCQFIFTSTLSLTSVLFTTPAVLSHITDAVQIRRIKYSGTAHAQKGRLFSSMENY